MEVMNDAQAVQKIATFIITEYDNAKADRSVIGARGFHAFFEGMRASMVFMGVSEEIWWEAFDSAFDL